MTTLLMTAGTTGSAGGLVAFALTRMRSVRRFAARAAGLVRGRRAAGGQR